MEDDRRRNENRDASELEDLNLKANWNDLRGKISKEYSDLTDDDLQFMGTESDMIGRLHRKTGKTKSEVRRWLQSLSKLSI